MPIFDYDLFVGLTATDSAEAKHLELYPDTIPYDFTSEEYDVIWARLNNQENGSYLYTNGYILKRAGTFRYAWENIRSFFGYENRCEPARTKMALQKFVYFGYLKGFNQAPLTSIFTWSKPYQLSADFIEKAQQPRTDLTSGWLQTYLIQYFKDNYLRLLPGYWRDVFSDGARSFPNPAAPDFKFGDTLMAKPELEQYAIHLEPRNKTTIDKLVKRIAADKTLASSILKESQLASAYADNVIEAYKAEFNSWTNAIKNLKTLVGFSRSIPDVAPMNLASDLDSTARIRHKEIYINMYLNTKRFDEALSLLVKLEDINQAVVLIKQYKIDVELSKKHIVKDSALGIALAKSYMSDADLRRYDPKNSNTNNAEQFVSAAALHREYPAYCVLKYVETNQFDTAYEIYQAAKDKSIFDKKAIKKLADYFHKRGEEFLTTCEEHARKGSWDNAEKILEKSNAANQTAYELAPDNKEYAEDATMNSYQSGRLILLNSTMYGDQRANRIDMAIAKLTSSYDESTVDHDREGDALKSSLIKALLERANIAFNLCFVEIDTSHGNAATSVHNKISRPHMEKAIECCKKIIKLNSKGGYAVETAQANFMIAELHYFFDEEKNIQEYKRAMELVPSNPFYMMRYSEVCINQVESASLRNKALVLFRDSGIRAIDYMKWYEQRWLKNPSDRTSGIKNIHEYRDKSEPAKGFLSRFGFS